MKGKVRLSLSQVICLSRARTRRVRKALQQDVAKLAFLQVPSAFHFSKPVESEVYFRSVIATLTLFGFTFKSNGYVPTSLIGSVLDFSYVVLFICNFVFSIRLCFSLFPFYPCSWCFKMDN